jgi:hypothetical protein
MYSFAQSATNERIIKRSCLFQGPFEDGMNSAYAAALDVKKSGTMWNSHGEDSLPPD